MIASTHGVFLTRVLTDCCGTARLQVAYRVETEEEMSVMGSVVSYDVGMFITGVSLVRRVTGLLSVRTKD